MGDTIVATAIAAGSAGDAVESLSRTLKEQLAGRDPVLVMAFASTAQPIGEVLAGLGGAFDGACVIGCSTAGEFTEAGDTKSSTSAVAIAGDMVVSAGLGEGLAADPDACIDAATSGLPHAVDGYPHVTAVLLLDPLAGNGEEATLIAAEKLGFTARLAGGAAGDDLRMERTEVGAGGRTASDAAVVALLYTREPLGVGVAHGHVPLSDPVQVTRAEGATIHEIDGRPAWDVWVDKTRAAAAAQGIDPESLAEDDVISYLLRYEAGLSVGGDGYKIRAPLVRNDDGSISFACAVPQGSAIRITESVPERQVDSARTAARMAREQLGGAPVAGAVVFDCICRNLILGDAFEDAVKGISEELGNAPIAGFETYGEIALDVGDMSGFHNTTTVVLAFPA